MSTVARREAWGVDLEAALCPDCDHRFLYPAEDDAPLCPLCFRDELVPLNIEEEHLPYTQPPELALPFTISEARFAEQVDAFTRAIPFAPADLTPQNLRQRTQRLYLSRWLVDADVEAEFQAEVGFDYQVVSHRERYAGDRWQTEEVQEDRVRWEPRAGRLHRHYANVPLPALAEEAEWQRQLGAYSLDGAAPYKPEELAGAMLTLPDRSPADAWPDAVPAVRQAAQEECRQAAQAQHIRDFRWSPAYGGRNWTQLLRPVYATYYRDDEGRPRPVFLNGQTGQISGIRRASMVRARRVALGAGGAAALVLLVALILGLAGFFLEAALFTPAALGLGLAFILLVGALVPLLIVWRFNRRRA